MIGASEVATMLGKSTNKKFFDLLAEKSGLHQRKQLNNPAVNHGKMLESGVIEMLEIKLGTKLHSPVLESTRYPGLVAQIDALSNDYQIEIKCPWRSSSAERLINRELPLDYLYQMQAQLMVTGRDKVLFVVYYKQDVTFLTFEKCPEMQAEIQRGLEQFQKDLRETLQANKTKSNAHALSQPYG